MKQNKFAKMTLIAVFAFIGITTSPVVAQSGANGSGGAHGAPDNQLLDLHEARGSKKMNPLAYPGVQESLNDIAMKLPSFADQMKQALNKPWYFVESELSCPGGESMLDIKKEPVACQNKFEVLISEKWFNSPPNFEKRDQENELYSRYIGNNQTEALKIKQHATIIHELLRNLRLKKDRTADSEAGLRYLVRTLIPNAPDEGVLQKAVAKADFSFHSSGTFIREMTGYLVQVSKAMNGVYEQTPELIAAARHMSNQLEVTYQRIAQPAVERYNVENSALRQQLQNRKISADIFLTEADALRKRLQVEIDAIIASFDTKNKASIEMFDLSRLHQLHALLSAVQAAGNQLSDNSCGLNSLKEFITTMQGRLTMETKNFQNNWVGLASNLENLAPQQRANQIIERIKEQLFYCENPKS